MTDLATRIATLTEGELRGWWLQVTQIKARPEVPGERAMLMDRARQIGLEIKGVDLA